MATTRRPLAEQQAAADTAKALALAVREHERQQALQEEVAIRRAMGERERARTYRAPVRAQGMTDPRIVQGLAQAAPLHRQDPEVYRRGPAPAPQLTPGQQEALDAQIDYNREWLTRDEAGNTHLARRPLSESGIVPMAVAVERGLQGEEEGRYVPKPAKKPKPMKVRT